MLRVTSLEAPDQGASYQVISDEATFVVRVGYDGLRGRRPPDADVLPVLEELASGH